MKPQAVLVSMFWLLLPAACIEPYYPPSGAGTGNQMVINGYIDGVAKMATVKLTRGVALAEAATPPNELDAAVTITGSDGSRFTLGEYDEDHKGVYTINNITFSDNISYTLNVVTESGNAYSSDKIEMLHSPSFDSISWVPRSTGAEELHGVYFYVSAHDPGNETHYYRWTFNETWEYNVPAFSEFKRDGHQPISRDSDEFVYICWSNRPSTNILINSTTRLSEDRVSMYQLYFLQKGSRKLSRHYRLAVKQYAMSKPEYEFWDLIEKSSESMGGLFDPLPTQVFGNVHSDNDPNEPVLGYFSGGYPSEKILYVDFLDLPRGIAVIDPWSFQCAERALYTWQLDQMRDDEVFVRGFGTPVIQGYVLTSGNCGDCTTLGGSNAQPPDWLIK